MQRIKTFFVFSGLALLSLVFPQGVAQALQAHRNPVQRQPVRRIYRSQGVAR